MAHTTSSNESLNGQNPVRRIYKGDVPYIYDNDNELVQKVICQNNQRCFRFRGRSETDLNPPVVTPVTVRRQSIAQEGGRPVFNENYPDNSIVTSRYTVWNFLPKNLFEQFRRVVNFYFLIVAFVHSIIDGPVPPFTAVFPLTFVIFVTAMKQGYEDWLRHKNDDHVNNRGVRVIREGKLREIKSKSIQVGDIIRLEADEQVPTDILLLGSSDEFLRCQINTANLDGETNLKLRYCPSGLPHFKVVQDFESLHLIVECEQPCEDLYEFNGSVLIPADKLAEMHWSPTESMTITSLVEDEKNSLANQFDEESQALKGGLVRQAMTDFLSIPVSMENMVLRGTRLKNTEFIYGIVVYTGRDTRLARNSESVEAKFSSVEKATNYYLIFFMIVLVIMVVFAVCLYYAHYTHQGAPDGPWYLNDHNEEEEKAETRNQWNKTKDILNTIGSFVVLYNYIIPISLYVTIELQKFLGSKFFVWDNEMVDEEGKEPLCNTSDLNEELGQIEYLFSDKTGTLTQNVMQFRDCSINASRYEFRRDDKLYRFSSPDIGKPVMIDGSKEVLDFFKTLALCHSVQVVPKRRPSYDSQDPTISIGSVVAPISPLTREEEHFEIPKRKPSSVDLEPSNRQKLGTMEFQASSPDEKALLETCERLGIVYRGEKEDVLTVDVLEKTQKFRRLMTLEFDADRKCMSVIVENSAGEIWLLTKGAETSVIPKCTNGATEETLRHINDFAFMGLRTLAVAVRKLTLKEYEEFFIEIRAARRLLKNRQEKVREVYSSIESQMTLIGATGVEDQLQEHVPETLRAFARAGIRVWMLTGDKLETGVNVAVACGLITASTKQYIVKRSMNEKGLIAEELRQIDAKMDKSYDICFVIDGESLSLAFKECPELLCAVSMRAYRVVCCRMAPLQKAQVVQMVKNSPGRPTCCAVGDGANDCAMILAAHIGIGILGKEGRQAARCADFALAKFGFLRKAILVHGHWYYVRLANLAIYFFYKNVAFVFPQYFFTAHTGFSTEALYNGQFLMNFNILYVACPIFYYGLTEQPYSAETLLANPFLYKRNRKNAFMSVKSFIPWMLSAIWHSVVCFYVPYYAWDNFDHMNDTTSLAIVIFSCIVIVTNMKMAIETKFLSWWYLVAHIYSYFTFFLITSLHSEVDLRSIGIHPGEFRQSFYPVLCSANFWLLLLIVMVVALIPDFTVMALKNMYNEMKSQFEKELRDKISSATGMDPFLNPSFIPNIEKVK